MDNNYIADIETSFAQLFGESLRGVKINYDRDLVFNHVVYGPFQAQALDERYTLTVQVVCDMDYRETIAYKDCKRIPYNLEQFNIGIYRPQRIAQNEGLHTNKLNTYFLVEAEYIVRDLPEFLEQLNTEAQKAFDERFYEAMDRVVKS